MKISLNNFVLADSPDAIPLTNLRINGSRQIQQARFFRAASIQCYDRGNHRTEITFDTTRSFPDQVSAEKFLLDHESTFPGRGLVSFVAGRPGTPTATRYLPNAAVDSVHSSLRGCTTVHSYKITGGLLQSTSS